MNLAGKIVSVVVFSCMMMLDSSMSCAEEYKIGVLAKSGSGKVITQWGGHGDYLSKVLEKSFTVVPVTFSAMDSSVKEKKIDFMLANPAIFIEMKEKYGAAAIATMINKISGKSVHQFGGVVFARKDSPVATLNDVKGKRFGFVKKSSFGGLHAALYLLKTNGIDPEKDCSLYEEMGTHEKVVKAVADGFLDVGTVRTDTLERMAEDGKININDFKIINKVEDDFPFVHSTILYPEWPMAVLSHVDKGTAEKVSSALLQMKENDETAQSAKIVGWKSPVDYGPVLDCLKTIGATAGE